MKKQHLLSILKIGKTILADGVALGERLKNKRRQVFKLSFDARHIEGEKQINAVLDYIAILVFDFILKAWKE